jgi:hypothetical protein
MGPGPAQVLGENSWDNYELSVWVALHIYIRLGDNSNIESY